MYTLTSSHVPFFSYIPTGLYVFSHQADIDHRTVCRHVRNYPGIWLNSNMQDHEAMDAQKPFDIVEISSPDGTNKRRIGLIAVLSDGKDLLSFCSIALSFLHTIYKQTDKLE